MKQIFTFTPSAHLKSFIIIDEITIMLLLIKWVDQDNIYSNKSKKSKMEFGIKQSNLK